MHMIFLFLIIFVYGLVIRLGTIAFAMTGLDEEIATFQTISCLTCCGFSTKESESIMMFPARRKIAMFLMAFGFIGLASFITTTVSSMTVDTQYFKFNIPIIDWFFSSPLRPYVNLLVIIVAIYATYKFFMSKALHVFFQKYFQAALVKRGFLPINLDYGLMSVFNGENAIARLIVRKENGLAGVTLARLKELFPGIVVLSVERNGVLTANLLDTLALEPADKLIVYSSISGIHHYFEQFRNSA